MTAEERILEIEASGAPDSEKVRLASEIAETVAEDDPNALRISRHLSRILRHASMRDRLRDLDATPAPPAPAA
jgi:hypothetical protein